MISEKECQLQNFLSESCATIRTWVERGNGTASFYQLSVDEAYCLLEDMANYDNWSWNHSPNNQGWDESSSILEPWDDTQLHYAEASLDLQALFA